MSLLNKKKNGHLSGSELMEQLRKLADQQNELICKAEECGHDMSDVRKYEAEQVKKKAQHHNEHGPRQEPLFHLR